VQAEVSADNVSLEFTTDAPRIMATRYLIDDSAGNDDGFLDPGETAELLVTLQNFGEPATGVTANLGSSDPYVIVGAGSAAYGDLDTGDTAVNLAAPYEVTADMAAPLGHLAPMDLAIGYDGGGGSCGFSMLLGRFHYLVWDPSPDQSSGPVIANTLSGLGFTGNFTGLLPVDELDKYQSLWISLGIYSGNYVIAANGAEAQAIETFMDLGGHVYMEGSDCWYYDPGIGGHSFNTRFGLIATSDGSGDCGPVYGEPGTFCQDMVFQYNGENNYIDHLSPTASSELILENGSPVYGLAVAHEAAPAGPRDVYRTVGASFEFAGLVDGTGMSTKQMLAIQIMNFFLGTGGTAADEAPALARGLQAWPNPFNPKTQIRFELAQSGPVELAIFDLRGRRVATLLDETMDAGPHETAFMGVDEQGHSLPSGVYFAKVTGPELDATTKLVLLK